MSRWLKYSTANYRHALPFIGVKSLQRDEGKVVTYATEMQQIRFQFVFLACKQLNLPLRYTSQKLHFREVKYNENCPHNICTKLMSTEPYVNVISINNWAIIHRNSFTNEFYETYINICRLVKVYHLCLHQISSPTEFFPQPNVV